MTHDPLTALTAAVNATRAYQSTLAARQPAAPKPRQEEPAPPQPSIPDAEALARLTAPAVSRLIARDIRERRSWP